MRVAEGTRVQKVGFKEGVELHQGNFISRLLTSLGMSYRPLCK